MDCFNFLSVISSKEVTLETRIYGILFPTVGHNQQKKPKPPPKVEGLSITTPHTKSIKVYLSHVIND